ncbi:MAG TPA: hypothetical protein PLS50_00935, partial [Candidatus Dojkabacteria bacterium]|nr:hypothetical protein [Candidatus Dojkabacteria bacterium]
IQETMKGHKYIIDEMIHEDALVNILLEGCVNLLIRMFSMMRGTLSLMRHYKRLFVYSLERKMNKKSLL